MHPQLAAVIHDFESDVARLERLAREVPADAWHARPAPGRWSVAECVAHLNLTSEAYLPILDAGIARARERARGGKVGAPARIRRDVVGWMLWKTLLPPARVKARTTPDFEPVAASGASAEELVAAFARMQREQIERVRAADGLPIHRVRIPSPFSERVRYSLYSGFTILAAHQQRHLAQAEEAWRSVREGGAAPARAE